jgi:predicted amidohydrolase YtcJ
MTAHHQLYFGGPIYTIDDLHPKVEAVAVSDGRILAAGSLDECRSELRSGYESIDLEGRVMLPGFIDSHIHPPMMIIYEMGADLTRVESIEKLQGRLRAVADKAPSSNWIMGFQFEEQHLETPRMPTRHDLDRACPHRPAFILKHDCHTIIANSRAIEAAGISAGTPDPRGGRIDRETDGNPVGVFRETAMHYILRAMPLPEVQTVEAAAASVFKEIAAHGITSAGMILQTDEEGVSGAQGRYDIPLMEAVVDTIPVNLYGLLVARDYAPIQKAMGTRLHREQIGGGHRIGGLKFFADGTFASCTAFMNQPFADQTDTRGGMIHSADKMYARMVMAHTSGLQIAIHSIGDASSRICVDLYERLLREYPRKNHRHRLEHASQLDEGLIADIARLNLVVATQPLFIHSEKDWLHKRLGKDRTPWTYPLRALFDAGITVAGGSDAPIESMSVLHALQCCVTREGFEVQQGIGVTEALRMFTINAAFAQFEDAVKGSITPGKRADMVILSDDPVSVPVSNIKDIQVLRTICGGKEIYKAAPD